MSAVDFGPVTTSVECDKIKALVGVLEIAAENAKTILDMHDSALGRTTPKNKRAAQILEQDVELTTAHLMFWKGLAGD